MSSLLWLRLALEPLFSWMAPGHRPSPFCAVATVSGDVLPQELPHQIGNHTPVFLEREVPCVE